MINVEHQMLRIYLFIASDIYTVPHSILILCTLNFSVIQSVIKFENYVKCTRVTSLSEREYPTNTINIAHNCFQ